MPKISIFLRMTTEDQLACVMNQDRKEFTGPSSYLKGMCTDVLSDIQPLPIFGAKFFTISK